MKNILLVIFVLVFVSVGFGQQSPVNDMPNTRRIINFPKPEQMFEWLEGEWIFDDMKCAEPYTVTVSADRKSIKFQYAKPQKLSDGSEIDSFTYDVLEVGEHFIRTQIKGESRKTAKGDPVRWDFMFLSPNEFVWHRADWKGLSATKSILRCPGGNRSDLAIANGSIDPKPPAEGRIARTENSISGGILNGKAKLLARPEYPAAARAVRATGAVNVQVTIDEQGTIISASAISGHPLLRQAAEKAAFASKFEPTLLEGQPVQVTGVIVYNFVP